MEEETDWSQISRIGQRSYINARPHSSGAVSEILEKYELGWISRRWDVGIWTGMGWPRIETGGGRL